MLITLVALGAFLSWFMGEAPIPGAESLVGRETVAFTFVHLDEQDPGVKALLQNTLDKLKTALVERSNLPSPVRETLRKVAPANVRNLLPIQIVVTYDRLPPTRPTSTAPARVLSGIVTQLPESEVAPVPTYVVSFGRFKGVSEFLFRTLIGAHESPMLQYRGFDILPLTVEGKPSRTAFLAHVRNNYVFSYRLNGVHLLMDRLLSDSGAFGGRPELGRMLKGLDVRQDMLGIVTNEGNGIPRFLDLVVSADGRGKKTALGQEPLLNQMASRILRVGWDLDILSSDELSLHLRIECVDAPSAVRSAIFLRQVGHDLTQEGMLESTVIRVDAREVEATLRTSALQRIVAGMGSSATKAP